MHMLGYIYQEYVLPVVDTIVISCALIFIIYISIRRIIGKGKKIPPEPETEKRTDIKILKAAISSNELKISYDETTKMLDEYFRSSSEYVVLKNRQFRWSRMVTLTDLFNYSDDIKQRIKLVGFFKINISTDNLVTYSVPESFDGDLSHTLRKHIIFQSTKDMKSELDNYVYVFTIRIQNENTINEYIIRTGGTENLKTRMGNHASFCKKDYSKAFNPGKIIAHFLISNPKSCVRVYAMNIKSEHHVVHDDFLSKDKTDSKKQFIAVYDHYESLLTDAYTEIATKKFNDLVDNEKRPLLCMSTPTNKRRKCD